MNSKSNAPALLRQGPRPPLGVRGRRGEASKKREIIADSPQEISLMPVYEDFEVNDGYITLFAKL